MALPRWPNQFILFCLISLVQAYTVFETNCSTPATLSNYVSSPNTRGTLDILWSSVFTIFACTWSVQHPNVPEQQQDAGNQTSKGWWRGDKWVLRSFYRSTLRMLWTVIAPELIIVAACDELLEARKNYKKMQGFASEDGLTWSLTHSYYANMGGFVVRNPLADKEIYHDPYHLTGEEIFDLRKRGHITKLPDMTEAEIKDKSKGDMLGKMIALGQIAWSTIQIIVRVARRLPVSPLEVAVVAFAVCAVLIYVLYWNKPQRVGVTQTIQINDIHALYNKAKLEASPRFFKGLFQGMKSAFGTSFEEPLRGAPINVDSIDNSDDSVLFIASASAAVFGGIHALAWNFAFPSRIELVFWRCASIYSAAAPACSVLFILLSNALPSSNRLAHNTPFILAMFLLVLYPIPRLFIIVEMFRTLYFLPPASFISTWPTNVPHLA
ncbi:hypothetical protein FP744_10003754 [Trichoderma asperellum]|nr:hypothetical protein LI328DRAFT_160503 [Trichoderma asperelloides]